MLLEDQSKFIIDRPQSLFQVIHASSFTPGLLFPADRLGPDHSAARVFSLQF